jgi:hypothetical protein
MKKYLTILIFVLLFVAPVAITFAAGDFNTPCPGGVCKLDNPLNPNGITDGSQIDSPQKLIGIVINSVLGVVGSIALLMFIYGGLTWMTSSGNAEKVKKGRDIILWSAIGLVVIFSAYALTRFVLSTIVKQ